MFRKKIKMIFFFFYLPSFIIFPENGKIIAEIEDKKIVYEDFDKEIKNYRKSLNLKDRLNTLSEEGRKKILENKIREELFFMEAQKEGVELTEEEKYQIEKLKTSLIIRKYIIKKLAENPITEEEIKDYYEKHEEEFVIPEKRKISHIVVKEEEKAKEILKKLQENYDFYSLARENNIDGTREKGGELGWVSRNYFIKEFEDIAFKLKKGEISELVKTRFGYHIIKVEDIKFPEKRKYEEVKDEIKKRLEEERIIKLEKDLRNKYKVRVYYENIK